MGNLLNETKEERIDLIQEFYVMGLIHSNEIKRELEKIQPEPVIMDIKTIRNYVSIIQRRIRNHYKKINLDKILKGELSSLDYAEKQVFMIFYNAKSTNESIGAVNTILKCMDHRAKLLGLYNITLNENTPRTLEDLLREDV